MSKLEERLNEFIDSSGCVSGDCPHNKWADCAEHYKKSIKDFILEMPELKALVVALDKYGNSSEDVAVSMPFDNLDPDDFPIVEEFESGEPEDFGAKARQVVTQWRSFIGIDPALPGADVTKISCTCPACGKVAQVGKPSEYEPSLAEFHCGHCGVMGSINPKEYEVK